MAHELPARLPEAVTYRRWRQDDRDQLAARVVRVLPEPHEAPWSTPAVRERFPDLSVYERETYVRGALDRLVACGWAEKITGSGAASLLYWRLTPLGSDGRHTSRTPPSVRRPNR